MEGVYDPAAVERRWQETWEAEGLYAGAGRRRDDSYVICVPPPNVTGELHMGHALNGSIQDVLIVGTGCGASTPCGSPATTTRGSRPRT